MRAIIIIAVIITGIYFLFPTSFSKEFVFEGDRYGLTNKKKGGDIVNYFYTVDGEDITQAKKFIQLIEFKSEVDANDFENYLAPLLNRYSLKPIEGLPGQTVGNGSLQGMKIFAVGTPITVNEQQHYIIFLKQLDENVTEITNTTQVNTLSALKQLEHLL